jgi:hypothetical protein
MPMPVLALLASTSSPMRIRYGFSQTILTIP